MIQAYQMNKSILLLLLLFFILLIPFTRIPVAAENNALSLEVPVNEVWEWHMFPLVVKTTQDYYSINEGNLLVEVKDEIIFNESIIGMEVILLDLQDLQSPIDIDLTFSYQYENVTYIEFMSKVVNFDLDREHEDVQELSWLYTDYNYWGPNPAYQIIMNAQDTYFGRLEDRDTRFDDISQDDLSKYKTNPNDWAMIQNLTYAANRWQYFEYTNLYGTCDGPANLHKATFTFVNSVNVIVDNYDETSCSGGRSYVSEPFKELKNFIEMMVTRLETTLGFLINPSPFLALFFIPLFLLVIYRKAKS